MNARAMIHERWSESSNDVKGKFFEYVIQGLVDADCPKGGCAVGAHPGQRSTIWQVAGCLA